jgi:hypothetical protein
MEQENEYENCREINLADWTLEVQNTVQLIDKFIDGPMPTANSFRDILDALDYRMKFIAYTYNKNAFSIEEVSKCQFMTSYATIKVADAITQIDIMYNAFEALYVMYREYEQKQAEIN